MLDLEDLHSIISIISLLLRIVNEHDESFHLPSSAHLPSVMDCNDGRSITIISFEFIQYFQLLLMRNHGMHNHLMKWIVDLEDLLKSFHSNSFNTFDYC